MATASPSHPDIVSFLCRHLVAIVIQTETTGSSARSDAASAFVLQAGGKWHLVTAGHIIDRHRRALSHPTTKKGNIRLFDAWSSAAASNVPIPFDLASARQLTVDDGEGLDIGIVELPEIVRRQLVANGILAFGPNEWGQPPSGYDFYFLLGLPTQFTREVDGSISVSPTLIPLKERDAPAGMATELDRFYGQLPPHLKNRDGEVLTDIDGFSGGPVLGFRHTEDGLAYHVVAIQTTWRRDLRVAASNRIERIGRALELFGGLPDD